MHICLASIFDGADDCDNLFALLRRCILDAGLHDVAGELLHGKAYQITGDNRDNSNPVARSTVLNDMLSDIVAELINNQRRGAHVQLVEDIGFGWLDAFLQHALDNPTAVGMRREMMNLAGESIDNECDVLSRDSLDGLLNDMIAVLILDAFQNLVLKLLDQGSLLVNQYMLERL